MPEVGRSLLVPIPVRQLAYMRAQHIFRDDPRLHSQFPAVVRAAVAAKQTCVGAPEKCSFRTVRVVQPTSATGTNLENREKARQPYRPQAEIRQRPPHRTVTTGPQVIEDGEQK